MQWVALLMAFAFVAVVVLGYRRHWSWTGLTEVRWTRQSDEEVQAPKTLWDWLQLALIPLALATLAFLLNGAQTKRDQRHEDDRAVQQLEVAADAAREDTLRVYLTQMSDFMLDRRLLRSKEGADVRAVARITTLTAVRRLDGERRGVVIRFLAEAALLGPRVDMNDPFRIPRAEDELAKLDLGEADLRGVKVRGAALPGLDLDSTNLQDADLQDTQLQRVSLLKANLRGADLQHAILFAADLRRADLRDAALGHASLQGAYLRGAQIGHADLQNAHMSDANLQHADLRSADLRDTDLRGADLRGADLNRANLNGADLRGADLDRANGANLHGARRR